MLTMLLVLFLAAHLISVSVSAVGPLVCIWLERREGRGDMAAGALGRTLVSGSAILLFVGAVLGLGIGMLGWNDACRAAFSQLSHKISMGGLEYLFSQILLAAHAWWWWKVRQPSKTVRRLRMLVALLAGTNLLYHFPPLFAIYAALAEGSFIADGPIDNAAFRSLMVTGPILARVVHFDLAAVAITGVAIMGFALGAERRGGTPDDARRMAVWGARLAVGPAVLQLPTGLWLVMQLSPESQARLMGQSMLASTLFIASIVLALSLMHQLAAVAMGDGDRRRVIRAMAVLTVILFLMTAIGRGW